jgi:hypothetical protein
MKKLLPLLFFLVSAASAIAQVPFTTGNIVVYRVGDGSGLLNNKAAPVYLDEYTPTGILIQSIPMPVSTTGANKILTTRGMDQYSGVLTRSLNGQFLLCAGLNSPVGVADFPESTNSTDVTRTIGVINRNVGVNTTTSLTDYSSQGLPTCVVSTDGKKLWACGQGGNALGRGIRYTTIGSTNSVQINPVQPTFQDALAIASGQLYFATRISINPTVTYRIGTMGNGLPVTSGQTATNLPGVPLTGDPCQFEFADLNVTIAGPDVLYVANAQTGIEKYSLIGGVWTSNGVVGSDLDDYHGLVIDVSGTSATIYATRKGSNSASVDGGELVKLVDNTGYNGALVGTPTVIASTPIDTKAFRGIALAPLPPPACPSPEPIVNDITPNSAKIQWSPISSGATYEYAISPNIAPPLAGASIPDTVVNVTGLTPGLQYYAHVRSKCNASGYSLWATVDFIPQCMTPAVSATANAVGNADFTWNAVAGSANYEYALTSSSTPPPAGTVISGNSYHASGLLPVTQYYFHLRNNCSPGVYSLWTSIPFFTPCFIPNVTGNIVKNGFDFRWNKIPGSIGYELAVTNYYAPPLSGNVFLADTSYHVGSVDNGTGYYLHVRTKCSNGSFSEWSILDIHSDGLEAYPNPVRNTLTIRMNGAVAANGMITVTDPTGRLVKKMSMHTNMIVVSMNDVAAGIYLIKYVDGEKKYSLKILKK